MPTIGVNPIDVYVNVNYETKVATMNEDLERALNYPLSDRMPQPGRCLEVMPGIKWIRMSLPFALNHINLWTAAFIRRKLKRSGNRFLRMSWKACPFCVSL